MKVFVLFTQVVFGFEESNSIEVFSTKEKAMESFHKFVAREKKNADGNGWEIDLGEDSFEAFEEGFYIENHVLARVSELEVK